MAAMDMEGAPGGVHPVAHGNPGAATSGVANGLASGLDDVARWLVTKGTLDYGPYTLTELIEQIRTDQVVPGNMLMDNDTGERSLIEEHAYFGPLVEQARQARDDNRRANAELSHAKQSKRRGLALMGFITSGVVTLGMVAYLLIGRDGPDGDDSAPQAIAAIGAGELNAKISFPTPSAQPKKSARPGARRGAQGSDVMALDMAGGGGSERLSNDVINATIQKQSGALGRCLLDNGGGYAKIQLVIDGPTGRVSWVQVNGQQTGGLYACVNRAMRSAKFPAVDGPRTRAEFEMNL